MISDATVASDKSKCCTKCGEMKLLTEFKSAGSKRYPMQLRGDCTACVNKSASDKPKKTEDPTLMPVKCANDACAAISPTFTWRRDTGRYIAKCKQCIRQRVKDISKKKEEECAASDDGGIIECTDCGIKKPMHMFEGDRNYCKECHVERRKQTTLNNENSPDNTLLPVGNCMKCNTEFTRETAIWRNDSKKWRNDTCKVCPYDNEYSKRYRQKMKDEDYSGYLQRCNDTHRKWIARNPEKVAEYNKKKRTKPESRVSATTVGGTLK